MTHPLPDPAELTRLADTLEIETCVTRLLDHLFPDVTPEPGRPGRYQALERAVRTNSDLRRALLDAEPGAVTTAWNRCLKNATSNLNLQHTLAVIYREHALARIAETGSGGKPLVIASAFWVLVPATAAFGARTANRPGDAALIDRIAGELIDLNAAQGARALAAGDHSDARHHLRFLDACRSGADAVRKLLLDFGVPLLVPALPSRFAGFAERASAAFDHWCADVIADAELQAKDATAIAGMSKGVRLAYGAGIDVLTPLVLLDVPVPRVLTTGLEWYGSWCFDLHRNEDTAGIREKLTEAKVFADRLARVAKKGQVGSVEGQALSEYFMIRGIVCDDPREAEREFATSLEWNSANATARHMAEQTHLERAVKLINDGEFDEALRILGTHTAGADAETIRTLKAEAYLGRGVTAANKADLSASNEADDLLPGLNVKDLLGPGPDSDLGTELRRLLGRRRTGAGVMERAVQDLRTALRLAPEPERQTFIKQQLAQVLSNWAVGMCNAVKPYDPGAWEKKEEAVEMLEEATRLYPENSRIRQNLLSARSLEIRW